MRQFLPFFVAFATVWALQLYATAKQTQRFMREVGRLRQFGETAIGASGNNRMKRRSYVVLAADDTDHVTGASELAGITVFASPTRVPELVGRPLQELAHAPDGDRRSNGARMAARVLLDLDLDTGAPKGRDEDEDGDGQTDPVPHGAARRTKTSTAHLPSSTGSRRAGGHVAAG